MTTNTPEYMRAYYHRKRRDFISLFGAKCAICGCTDYDQLQIDHIKGHNVTLSQNGTRGGITNLWDAIKIVRAGRKDEIRILCNNCNMLSWR